MVGVAMAGRPHKPFDWDKLNAILQYGANLSDASEIMGVSEDTILRRIKKEHGMEYATYKNKKMGKVRIGLLRKQVEVAMSGNVSMLIWLGKQHLDQKDKQEIEQLSQSTIRIEKIEENL
jgi:hypothetical protein